MRIAVAIFAASWYRAYVPLFLFCLFKAYPDYEAIVFLRKPLGYVEKPGMKLVKDMGNFELAYGDSLRMYPKLPDRGRRVQLFQAVRFLVLTSKNVKQYLSKYDYVYITDVDILIMPEEIPLHEQHLRHMEVLGLPYSNFVRNTDPPRLTGLHFGTREFFETVGPVVDRYASKIVNKGWSIISGLGERGPDEAMWYRIVQESGIGLPPKCLYTERETWEKVFDSSRFNEIWFGPHHGVHVGFGRAMKRFRDVFKTKQYRQYLASLKQLRKEDDRFDKICGGLHPRAQAAMKAITRISV